VQAGGAFTAILAAMTVVVEHFEGLSRLSAGVDRLYGFARSLDARADGAPLGTRLVGGAPPAPGEADGPRIDAVAGHRLALEHVTLTTPDRSRTLVVDLTVEVAPGRGLLIAGGSGGGKSSLLRAVAGLWTAGSGRIERPGPEHLVFLPQQPYMALGSLRDQLLYPRRERAAGDPRTSDMRLLELLAQVNLGELADRLGGLDAVHDWAKVLSLGEQQRLAFARVLLAEPRFAMLDEATSALDAANEERLYRALAATRTTPVSVSHRSGVVRFHADVLELPGDGSWRVLPAEGYRLD
jgi:putative ATP-binding cassette transporter